VDAADLRRIALGLPGAEEKAHFGKADFRVRTRIFATLPVPGKAVFKFTPDEQAMLVEAEPTVFRPVPGGWGRKGWTEADLSTADEATLASACLRAWRNVAPPTLARRQSA